MQGIASRAAFGKTWFLRGTNMGNTKKSREARTSGRHVDSENEIAMNHPPAAINKPPARSAGMAAII